MTQTDFANRLGVTGASVSAYENGTRLPSYDVLIRIANVLGVSTDELLGRKESTKITVDITNLSPRERNIVQELIDLFSEGKIQPQNKTEWQVEHMEFFVPSGENKRENKRNAYRKRKRQYISEKE